MPPERYCLSPYILKPVQFVSVYVSSSYFCLRHLFFTVQNHWWRNIGSRVQIHWSTFTPESTNVGEKKAITAAQQGAHSAGSLKPTMSDFYLKIKAKRWGGVIIILCYTNISLHRCPACGHFSRTLDKPLVMGNLLVGCSFMHLLFI